MTTSPGIAFLPCSYSWPTGLGTSFGMLKGTTSSGVTLSPSVILVCRGQSCPRQYILVVWIPFVRPQAFLPPRHGPWAWYEMSRSSLIFWPHKYNHNTKFRFKTNQTLTMETILIITKKEMFSNSSRNYIRNKVKKFKTLFFNISFNLIYNIYIIFIHYYFWKSNEQCYLSFILFVVQIIS